MDYAYQLLMLVFCVYAIAAVLIGSLSAVPEEIQEVLLYADLVLCTSRLTGSWKRNPFFRDGKPIGPRRESV